MESPSRAWNHPPAHGITLPRMESPSRAWNHPPGLLCWLLWNRQSIPCLWSSRITSVEESIFDSDEIAELIGWSRGDAIMTMQTSILILLIGPIAAIRAEPNVSVIETPNRGIQPQSSLDANGNLH